MSKFKHTKGPYHGDEFGSYVWAMDKDGSNIMIAQIRGWGYLTGKGSGALGLSHEEANGIQKANQALLSASPEMLEALIDCVNALYDAVQIAPLDRLPRKAPAAIQHGQYAVEKATGLTWAEI